jgi:hypothetical protein
VKHRLFAHLRIRIWYCHLSWIEFTQKANWIIWSGSDRSLWTAQEKVMICDSWIANDDWDLKTKGSCMNKVTVKDRFLNCMIGAISPSRHPDGRPEQVRFGSFCQPLWIFLDWNLDLEMRGSIIVTPASLGYQAFSAPRREYSSASGWSCGREFPETESWSSVRWCDVDQSFIFENPAESKARHQKQNFPERDFWTKLNKREMRECNAN